MNDPQRLSRTLIEVKFIPRERCDNCRTRPAVVDVTRRHSTMDFEPYTHHAGSYKREEKLCQPCANEVVREESSFLDSIIDDGKPMLLQSQVCIRNQFIGPEDCGCTDCLDELEVEEITRQSRA